MNTIVRCALAGFVVLAGVSSVALSASGDGQDSGLLRVYQVNKKVCDFPDKEDFSTPEAACATITRLRASGDQGFWRRVSAKRLAPGIRVEEGKRKVPESRAKAWLNTEIIEVRILRQKKYAGVIAKNTHALKNLFWCFSFELENGRWLNAGESYFDSLEEALRHFGKKCVKYARPKRLKINNPQAHLKPFVEFLKANGQEPKAFVMSALIKHQITIIGEIHHRPRYWAFNCSLVADPDFARHVGTIYMELPSNHQSHIDAFLAQTTCEKELVIQMLRDFFELGWPCKPTLEFFVAVWEVNQQLPSDKKLRIRLVDMPRPWEKIQKREDWRPYNVDRDKYMAENIIHDIQSHPDEKRNGLFIVGIGHAALHFDRSFFGGYPIKTAGWHLQQKLGLENVYAIMQHRCVMTNKGDADGRLQLGLFDSAFSKLGDKPIAFTLEQGPFGEQMYDGEPDKPVWSTFRDGFNAYLYLGPLETEIVSPLIEGFYSKEFVPEIDRRYQLMHGEPLHKSYGWPAATPERVTAMQEQLWGQPHQWVQQLGPQEAWHNGDDWQTVIRQERHRDVTRKELTEVLDKIYRGIRGIDPEKYSWRTWPREFGFNYQTISGFDELYRWWCNVVKKHPLESVQYGKLSRNEKGLPQIDVTTTLQHGITFSKVFVFTYIPLEERWQAKYGLDLHLDEKWKDFPKTGKIPSP